MSRTRAFPFVACLSLATLAVIAGGTGGCDSSPKVARDDAFGPSKVRLHPTFTQVKDWTGDGKPDGVEAVVELLDSFGEPTRGSGKFLFDLSDYRSADADATGGRVAGPWVVSLQTRDEQLAHWNTALRAYTFQLPQAKLRSSVAYVLDVSYDPTPSDGATTRPTTGRLFDRLIVEPPAELKKTEKEIRRDKSGRRPGH
jgi:hypothetical protein